MELPGTYFPAEQLYIIPEPRGPVPPDQCSLSLLALSPALPGLAGWLQHCGMERSGCRCRGVMTLEQTLCTSWERLVLPQGKEPAQHPNLRCKKHSSSRYFSPSCQPAWRICLPEGIQEPACPLPAADGCALVSPMVARQQCLRGSELTREDGLK